MEMSLAIKDDLFHLVSIDPGSDTVGIALNRIDLRNKTHTVLEAITLHASRSIRNDSYYQQVAMIHGDRYARIAWIQSSLVQYLTSYRPDAAILESPFFNRLRPGSYGPLVETLTMLIQACKTYDPFLQVDTVPPQQAKAAIKITSKDDVYQTLLSILGHPDHRLYLSPSVNLSDLSEHALDAILIGHYAFKAWVLNNPIV